MRTIYWTYIYKKKKWAPLKLSSLSLSPLLCFFWAPWRLSVCTQRTQYCSGECCLPCIIIKSWVSKRVSPSRLCHRDLCLSRWLTPLMMLSSGSPLSSLPTRTSSWMGRAAPRGLPAEMGSVSVVGRGLASAPSSIPHSAPWRPRATRRMSWPSCPAWWPTPPWKTV